MEIKGGLQDTIACDTRISSIIDETLSYAGYTIKELVDNEASFEEVIFLLWHLRLPTAAELADFSADLRSHMAIDAAVETCLRIQCRENLHPMSVLRSTVSLLGVFDKDAELTDNASTYLQNIKLQAKMPTIVAAFSRLRQGLDPIPPRHDLSFTANFLYMLDGHEPTETEIKILDMALVLHADHELNASTFAARVCASTLTDVYSTITTAIGTLKGSLHGGANERVFEMLVAIDEHGNAEEYLQAKLDSKEKIMGFGHRVYTTVDPRQQYLKAMAKELTEGTDKAKWYNISVEVETFIREKKGLIPNVDFYSATVYHCLGIDSDLFTMIFAMSRVSGWLAHTYEQKNNSRLMRPRSNYVGELGLVYVPIEARQDTREVI
ncbi:citrate synthase [Vagococcus sp. BWB3-3]|uniref:Citrate synthase n=1 Tax=Vagococcus allomyrinae TaxID=2794353 RepID=A0A940PES0_9ENTE|nr:citrate synthase [Vagococcus allomyrinae]MBP1043495.1 citrate synthase [Vagococcus allomyrinae]